MNQLSETDMNILIEGLDAWIDKGALGNMMGGMLRMFVPKDDPKAMEEWKRSDEESKAKYEYEKSQRAEIATLLKAKLITMKRGCLAGKRMDCPNVQPDGR